MAGGGARTGARGRPHPLAPQDRYPLVVPASSLTRRDLLALRWGDGPPGLVPGLRLLAGLAAAVAGFLLVTGLLERDGARLVWAAGAAVLAVLTGTWVSARAARVAGVPRRIEAGPEGFVICPPDGGQVVVAWTQAPAMRIGRRLVSLFAKGSGYVAIARRLLTPEQVEQLDAWARAAGTRVARR
ncbi:MAG: hypothetical protein U0Q15_08740 [Kineosporiaceae bacterium]